MTKIIAFDKFTRLVQAFGDYYVDVHAELEPVGRGYGSRPVSGNVTRSRALAYVREHLGADYKIGESLGISHVGGQTVRSYTIVKKES